MRKRTIKTQSSGGDDRPYSPAVVWGDLVFTSGYTGGDSAGKVPPGISAQTRLVLDHIGRVLEASNSSLDLVVKATVFLTDMRDYQEMNQVYKQYFPHDRPARSCVGVKCLTTPEKLIEIEVVAGTRG